MRASPAPKGWPLEIVWLEKPYHSKGLASNHLEAIQSAKDAVSLTPVESPTRCAQVRTITDSAHPANGQRGLFAARHLAAGSFVLPYYGYVHPKEESDEWSDYDLSLDRENGIGVDASRMGNEARFINDYRAVPGAEGPNAKFRDVWIEVAAGKAEKCVGVFVLSAGKSGKRASGIRKGEEILVSYGKGFWQARSI